MNVVLASALAGVATGGRSFTPLAVLVTGTPDVANRQPDRTLRRGPVRALITLAAVGELVGDKLPNTPSRLEPGPLIGRTLTGAACGAILARRSPVPASTAQTVLCAAVGAAGGFLGSYLTHELRHRAAAAIGADWPAAAGEDALILAASVLAVRG